MRRLRLLACLFLSQLAIACGSSDTDSTPLGPATLTTELGGGYNETLYNIDNALVAKSGVKWVRGFVNIPRNFLEFGEVCDIDGSCPVIGVLDGNISQAPDEDSGDSEILAISSFNKLIEATTVMAPDGQPIKIMLSLKTDFKYQNMGIPEANSPEMTFLLSAIDQLLEKNELGQYVDILVLGNEPMFETPLDGAIDLNNPLTPAEKYGVFLNLLIDNVQALKQKNGWKYEIFTGALNKAYELQNDKTYGPILQTILQVTQSRSEVSGIDLHLHVESVAQAEADVNFVRNALGAAKKIISTEFSLVGLWNQYSDVPLENSGLNGCPVGMKLYEWVNFMQTQATAGQPVSPTDMLNCFSSQTWYPQGWFSQFIDVFNNPTYNVYAATYGLESTPTIPAQLYNDSSTLWYLNFVYNCTLLGRSEDGYCNTNPLVFSDFEDAIQEMGNN